jgi:hypothetical protein
VDVAVIAMAGTVMSALILGPLVAFMKRFEKKNSEEHAVNTDLLREVLHTTRQTHDKLDEHLSWHLGSDEPLAPVRWLRPEKDQQ